FATTKPNRSAQCSPTRPPKPQQRHASNERKQWRGREPSRRPSSRRRNRIARSRCCCSTMRRLRLRLLPRRPRRLCLLRRLRLPPPPHLPRPPPPQRPPRPPRLPPPPRLPTASARWVSSVILPTACLTLTRCC